MRKALSNLAEASLQLGECLIDFGNYHGLPLQEFREWEWSLRVRFVKCCSISILIFNYNKYRTEREVFVGVLYLKRVLACPL